LVAVVLFFFSWTGGQPSFSFASIRFQLLAAVIVLDRFGVSLNTLTLGGFAIAIVWVVDDAIIDVENILRRVRENLTRSQPRPLFQGRYWMRHSKCAAPSYMPLLFVALVFFPILMMSGIQGKLFTPAWRPPSSSHSGFPGCRSNSHSGVMSSHALTH